MGYNEIKKLVLERDKKCLNCGATSKLTVDHIIPLSRGGTYSMNNLKTLCYECNHNKGSFISWDLWQRIQIALHADELVERTKNEIKGFATSWVGNLRKEVFERVDKEKAELQSKVDKQNNTINALIERIGAMERYHKIAYKKETIEVAEYRKLPKIKSPPN